MRETKRLAKRYSVVNCSATGCWGDWGLGWGKNLVEQEVNQHAGD